MRKIQGFRQFKARILSLKMGQNLTNTALRHYQRNLMLKAMIVWKKKRIRVNILFKKTINIFLEPQRETIDNCGHKTLVHGPFETVFPTHQTVLSSQSEET